MREVKNVIFGVKDAALLDFVKDKKFSTYVKELIRADMSKNKDVTGDTKLDTLEGMIRELYEAIVGGNVTISTAKKEEAYELDEVTSNALDDFFTNFK